VKGLKRAMKTLPWSRIDLERLIDEVVEEDELEDFMREESAMKVRLRDVEADGEEGSTDEARDCDFQVLKDLSLFHGKICVKGSKEDRTYFVLKGEDVEGALRAICVDTTTSKGQGKDMSNGGYFSTLASIKSIEGNSDADFSPVVHCIEELRDIYGNDVPKALFKWLNQKKQATAGSIAKVETVLADRASYNSSWSDWKVKDVVERLSGMKPAKLTTTITYKCRDKLKTKKKGSAKRRSLEARVTDDRLMIHDLEQCKKLLQAITEKLRISCERWCHTWGNREKNLRRLSFAACLPQTSLAEIPGVKLEMMKAVFDGMQHVVNATDSFDHGQSGADVRDQSCEGTEPSSTSSSSGRVETSGAEPSRSSSPDSNKQELDHTFEPVAIAADWARLAPVALRPIEDGLQAAESILGHAKTFCGFANIEIPSLKDHYVMRSLPGGRASRRYHEGCDGSISIKKFENLDLQMLVVDFPDGKNLHSCDIARRLEDHKLPMELRERIEKLLECRVPPRLVLEQIQEESRREGKKRSRCKVTLRTIYHILDHSSARWKLGETDEEDIAERVRRDRASDQPFIRAYKPCGVDSSDERCFGFENTGPPPGPEEFLVAMADEKMLENLRRFGRIVFWDATHIISRKKNVKLVSVMVADTASLGQYALWIITNVETEAFYKRLFRLVNKLHGEPGWKPIAGMCDMATPPVTAAKRVWGPSVRVMFCTWHVLKTFKENVHSKIREKDTKKKAEIRHKASNLLSAILYSRTKSKAQTLVTALRLFLRKHTSSCADLSSYVEMHYLDNLETFCIAWRNEIFEKTEVVRKTNMILENFHSVLKFQGFNGKRNAWIGYLMVVLQRMLDRRDFKETLHDLGFTLCPFPSG